MSTDRPTTSRPSRDAFWSLILTELRSNVMFLDPQFYDFDISSASDALSSFNIERERLISQLDDALELSTGRLSAVSSAASVNLHQVAADFAESYARRFGSESGRAISVLVDHKLPHIRTNPAQLLRLLDTLVRSAQRSTVTRKVELRLRESGTTKLLSTDCQLVLRCTGITLPITVSEAQRLLFDCKTELSFRAVRSFGIELCAALSTVYQLGGDIAVVEGPHSLVFEIRIPFEKVTEESETAQSPKDVYLLSQSDALEETFQNFATFHGFQLKRVTEASQVPENAPLVLDALTRTDAAVSEVQNQVNHSSVTILLPNTDVSLLRKLSGKGFRHFVTAPFVSSKIMRATAGLDQYQVPTDAMGDSSSRKLRILVVDDVPTARIALQDYFESLGHGVIEASDGSDFVMRIDRGEKFDIIFCDMAMSHMDGATAMQHVREHEKHTGTHTPIVLMTAYAEPGSHTKAGFDRVIHKPVDLNEVERAVRELVLAPRSGCYRLQPALVIDLPKLQRRCAGKTRTILRVLDSFIDAAEDQITQLSQPMIALERDMLLASITSVQRLLEDSVEPDRYGTIDTFCGKLRDPSYEPADDLPSVIRLIESACNNARALRQELADAAAK